MTSSVRRTGILGGTFDPIHNGHLDLGRAAQAALGLTRVIALPSNIPPHRPQPLASAFHRFAMTAMAVAGLSGWEASDAEVSAGSQSFTSDTLARLHREGHSAHELYFLTGVDAFLEIESWKDYPAILDCARFVVVARPGFPVQRVRDRLAPLVDRIDLIDARTSDVSASAIRERCAARQSIAGMVPRAVEQHIEQHALYSSIDRGAGSRGGPHGAAAGRLHGQD